MNIRPHLYNIYTKPSKYCGPENTFEIWVMETTMEASRRLGLRECYSAKTHCTRPSTEVLYLKIPVCLLLVFVHLWITVFEFILCQLCGIFFIKKTFRKSDTSITNSPLKKWKTVFTQRNNHKWLFIFSVDNHEEKNLKGTLLAVPNATVPTLVQVFCYSQILGFIQSIL